ncbi:hypothetical protein [Rhizobium laguerreae]|uniref:Uncharacterized protein n=1 Tax=Rhizobium laguerreae TaxID=1076926 RepID=A0A6N9ZNM8_9HYPH|nr:hypothetical protein [Rhizobium laguerreae]NEH94560.1 hypothetical protein [Rhizobium laguerreae]
MEILVRLLTNRALHSASSSACAEDLLHRLQMLGTSPSMTKEQLADFVSSPAKISR